MKKYNVNVMSPEKYRKMKSNKENKKRKKK